MRDKRVQTLLDWASFAFQLAAFICIGKILWQVLNVTEPIRPMYVWAGYPAPEDRGGPVFETFRLGCYYAVMGFHYALVAFVGYKLVMAPSSLPVLRK